MTSYRWSCIGTSGTTSPRNLPRPELLWPPKKKISSDITITFTMESIQGFSFQTVHFIKVKGVIVFDLDIENKYGAKTWQTFSET
jgi:hypothetical protein